MTADDLTRLLVDHGIRDQYDYEGEMIGFRCACMWGAGTSLLTDRDHAEHVAERIAALVNAEKADAWTACIAHRRALIDDAECGCDTCMTDANPYRP